MFLYQLLCNADISFFLYMLKGETLAIVLSSTLMNVFIYYKSALHLSMLKYQSIQRINQSIIYQFTCQFFTIIGREIGNFFRGF